ncbi:MAG: ATP-binding protein [Clostridia bacterium]|nr:ATP-binding protein [Clostridia bacterium]
MAEAKVLKVPAKLEKLDEILDFAGSLLEANGASVQVCTQVRMALEELYANVTLYAYPKGEDGWVEIRADVTDGVAAFQIIDAGKPFDPLAKPDPDILLSGEERAIGGLGIYMVKTMMDEVEYEYSGGCNRLTLRKKI